MYKLDPHVWSAIQHQQQHEVIKDIHGGKKYKELQEFTSQRNLTLSVNTDGVQLFKSSTVSMWPIWIIINELPISLRLVKLG